MKFLERSPSQNFPHEILIREFLKRSASRKFRKAPMNRMRLKCSGEHAVPHGDSAETCRSILAVLCLVKYKALSCSAILKLSDDPLKQKVQSGSQAQTFFRYEASRKICSANSHETLAIFLPSMPPKDLLLMRSLLQCCLLKSFYKDRQSPQRSSLTAGCLLVLKTICKFLNAASCRQS